MISVIIPTHSSPDALDLCLQSCIEGQLFKNEIIVIVDGFYDINKDVLEKWSTHIDILNMEENVGLCRGTNLGVYNAKHNKILIVNDDNVFPMSWDKYLLEDYVENSVLSPNQIEPYPSIFSQFHIQNLGTDPKTFNLKEFWAYEIGYMQKYKTETGSTLPIFMSKIDYLRVGGWDENYPTNGMVADIDFFHKCLLSGMKMLRTYKVHFYHFSSLSVNGSERQETEKDAHEYAKYKWGQYLKRDKSNNNII